jgi:beta-galactosidase GanA
MNGDPSSPSLRRFRCTYQKNLTNVARDFEQKLSHEASTWREFEQIAKPGFDSFAGNLAITNFQEPQSLEFHAAICSAMESRTTARFCDPIASGIDRGRAQEFQHREQ